MDVAGGIRVGEAVARGLEERNHVVVGALLVLGHERQIDLALAQDGEHFLGHPPTLCPRLGHGYLDFPPKVHLALRRPYGSHLRVSVAVKVHSAPSDETDNAQSYQERLSFRGGVQTRPYDLDARLRTIEQKVNIELSGEWLLAIVSSTATGTKPNYQVDRRVS